MTIPKFIGDEDKYEINPKEWLKIVKEHYKDNFQASLKFDGEGYKWWRSLHQYTRLHST
jgi:hypothetical protein